MCMYENCVAKTLPHQWQLHIYTAITLLAYSTLMFIYARVPLKALYIIMTLDYMSHV